MPRAVSNPVSTVTKNVTPAHVLNQPLYAQHTGTHKNLFFFWQWCARDSFTCILYNIDGYTRRREKCSVQSTVAVSRKFLLTRFRLASSNIRVCRFSKQRSILSLLSLPELWFYTVWLKFRFFYAMSRHRTLLVHHI